jgi:hypothetical protein
MNNSTSFGFPDDEQIFEDENSVFHGHSHSHRLDNFDISRCSFEKLRSIVHIDLLSTLKQLNHRVTRKMKITKHIKGRIEDKILIVKFQPW